MCRPTIEDTIFHERLVDLLGWDPGQPPARATPAQPPRQPQARRSFKHLRMMDALMPITTARG